MCILCGSTALEQNRLWLFASETNYQQEDDAWMQRWDWLWNIYVWPSPFPGYFNPRRNDRSRVCNWIPSFHAVITSNSLAEPRGQEPKHFSPGGKDDNDMRNWNKEIIGSLSASDASQFADGSEWSCQRTTCFGLLNIIYQILVRLLEKWLQGSVASTDISITTLRKSRLSLEGK